MTKLVSKVLMPLVDENLRRLLSMRALSMGAQLIVILFAEYYLDLSLPLNLIGITLICLVVWSVFTLFLLTQLDSISSDFFFFQLVIDVLALAVFLYLTGGATNPFAWFLLVPHSVAATLLPKVYVWLMAILTSLTYTLLVFFHRPLIHLDHPMEMGAGDHFSEHIVGMWIGFVLLTALMAYFVAGMAGSLRNRNESLVKMKEQIFRDERLVALGTMAASAAHELGTPLGTMDVVAHELSLELEPLNNASFNNQLSIIQGQIKRCKNVLSAITQTATMDQYDTGQLLKVGEYFHKALAQWRLSHLDVNFIKIIKGKEPEPKLVSDIALTYAFINILDNAADASPSFVQVTLDWDSEQVILLIEDQGNGMDASQLAVLGAQMVSSKEAGLGIGTYLAKASIERIGGEIRWESRSPKGLRVSITIPFSI
jgi:two-component system, sensor histidine kinase RegB